MGSALPALILMVMGLIAVASGLTEWSECAGGEECGEGTQQRNRVRQGGLLVTDHRNCSMPCQTLSSTIASGAATDNTTPGELTATEKPATEGRATEKTATEGLVKDLERSATITGATTFVPATEQASLASDYPEPTCGDNVQELVVRRCNVTCGDGYELILVLKEDGTICEDRLRPCSRNCANLESPVHYELMEDCAGDCEAGATTAAGVEKYMMFCNNVPCGLQKRDCTVSCQGLGLTGSWSVCSARCGAGTQTRIDPITGGILSQDCEGDFCSDQMYHINYPQTDAAWEECGTSCGVGVQKRDCQECRLEYDVELCTGPCQDTSLGVVWSDWSSCTDTCNSVSLIADVGVSTRYQVNCQPPDCRKETRDCGECSTNKLERQASDYFIHKFGLAPGDEARTSAAGDYLELTCYVVYQLNITDDSGYHDVDISWFAMSALDSLFEEMFEEYISTIQLQPDVFLLYNILKIGHLKPSHSGNYACYLWNTEKRHSQLNVIYFLNNPQEKTLVEGESTSLTCEVADLFTAASSLSASSLLYISWLRSESVLFTMVHVTPPFRSVVFLFDVDVDDTGLYRCKVRYGDLVLESDAAQVDVVPASDEQYEISEDFKDVWSEWSQCSSNCGIGFQIRGRHIEQHLTESEVTHCVPHTTCQRYTGTGLVTVEYTEQHQLSVLSAWSTWGDCDENTCLRTRTRRCLSGACDTKLTMVEPDQCSCNSTDNILHKREAEQRWGRYSQCSTTCGVGAAVRPLICGGDQCEKVSFELDSCIASISCKGTGYIDTGNITVYASQTGVETYVEWGGWGECDCNTDTLSRTRDCITQSCLGTDADCALCTRETEQEKPCDSPSCEGVFSEWGAWGDCQPQCGQGRRYRTRACTGYICTGALSDSELCSNGPCDDSDGYFTSWYPWSSCHNQDFRMRTRTCRDETDCPPSASLLQEREDCAEISGELLGNWVNQGSCNVGHDEQCGKGEQMKVRECFVDRSCPEDSFKSSECNDDNFFECTDIFKIVSCEIECDGPAEHSEDEWVVYGSCLLNEATQKCGKGKEIYIRNCFIKGECTKDDYNCSDIDILSCPDVIKAVDCDIPCSVKNEADWHEITTDCDTADCTISANFTTHYIELKYKSTRSFYGSLGFRGADNKIGYFAWSTSGIYMEGCGFTRFNQPSVLLVSSGEEITWTLYLSDSVVVLVAGGRFSYTTRIDDRCAQKYAASNVKHITFRNFRAVKARYSFVEKGKLGEWVDVGECFTQHYCGNGTRLQARACFEKGECPLIEGHLKECAGPSLVECSGLLRLEPCQNNCTSGTAIEYEKRSNTSHPGEFIEYGECVLPYGYSCGEGEIMMVYTCYLDNSCPSHFYTDNCTHDNMFECSLAFNLIPCHVPCTLEEDLQDLGAWEDVGGCEVLGASRCGAGEGSQLQVRECVSSKTCKRATAAAQCSDPWHCSEFYRTIPCNVSCEADLGAWVDLSECEPFNHTCGQGDKVQVKACYNTHSCPKWASSTLNCDGELTDCSPLFRAVDCDVPCIQEVEKWVKLGNCIVENGTCGVEGEQIMVRECHKKNECPQYSCTSALSCPEVFRTESCSYPCDADSPQPDLEDLGELISYGGCVLEEGHECGEGQVVHIFTCFFDQSCPGELAACQNFMSCPEVYTVSPCTVQCESPLGEWVKHGECHEVLHGMCGPGSGTQLLVRECIKTKTCPHTTQQECGEAMCSTFFSFESCDLACDVETDESLLGEWSDIYHCIANNHTTGCGMGLKPQMRDCMVSRSCPPWSTEKPSCFDHFNCTSLFRQTECFVICAESNETPITAAAYETDAPATLVVTPTNTSAVDHTTSVKDHTTSVKDQTSAAPNTSLDQTTSLGGSIEHTTELSNVTTGGTNEPRQTQLKRTTDSVTTEGPALTDLPTTEGPTKAATEAPLVQQIRGFEPVSCEEILQISTELSSGPQTLYSNGEAYQTWCEMEMHESIEPKAWTLLGSFVNTDGIVSWGGQSYANFVNTSTFGSWENAEWGDFKSLAWQRVKGTELMVEDKFGTLRFYYGNEFTMTTLLSGVSHCSTTPFIGPGANTDSTSAPWREAGVLLLLPEKRPGHGCNILHADESLTDKVPVLGFGGTGCGLMGAGMANSYSDDTLDWHMSLNPNTTCTTVSCDKSRCSGLWNGVALATSEETNVMAGVHDDSTWGKIYIR